jgi:hypothetical protein
MSAATVTIGRNVGDQPMTAAEWQHYRADVRAVLDKAGAETWVDADYRGSWDGATEDAHVWLAQLERLDSLRPAFAALAERYHQDAIGLVVGTPELVGRRQVAA